MVVMLVVGLSGMLQDFIGLVGVNFKVGLDPLLFLPHDFISPWSFHIIHSKWHGGHLERRHFGPCVPWVVAPTPMTWGHTVNLYGAERPHLKSKSLW